MSWFRYKGSHKPVSTRWSSDPDAVPAPSHGLLESLFAWERRCRGYSLFPEPVELEPTFQVYDDRMEAERWDAVPQPSHIPTEISHQSLVLPIEQAVSPQQLNVLWQALRGLQRPLTLEIVADAESVRYQLTSAEREAELVRAAFLATFPNARIENNPDLLIGVMRPLIDKSRQAGWDVAWKSVDLGLGESVVRPLRILDSLQADPHGPLIGMLGGLEPGEVAGIQLTLQPASTSWPVALEDWLLRLDEAGGNNGRPAHPGTKDTDLERALRYKLGSPLWTASFRVFAAVSSSVGKGSGATVETNRALTLCRDATQAFDFTRERSHNGVLTNELLALDDAGYDASDQFSDLLERRTRRTGMLLSQAELAGLWHPPSPSLRHPKLARFDPSQRELPPYLCSAEGNALGVLAGIRAEAANRHPDSQAPESQLVPWPDDYRNRHFYMLGATRMGKSTLLHNLIVQDLWAGRGLCLIDPHGDLARDVLATIPPERETDVLYLDLSDTAHPPALGLLQAGSDWEKRLLVSDLLSILHRVFSASWGDRLEHILRHALLTLLADDGRAYNGHDAPVHTLRDIRSLLADEAYREDLLSRLGDPDLLSFWRSEFNGYNSTAFAPIYNKLGLLLSSPVVRNIVAGRQSKLDPAELIRGKRVLIVNLASSLIGLDNAHFLGALLVSKIQLAAMHGLRHGQNQRVPFTLYVDEFQNFVVSSFESILSEAGKAGLSLVMANQFLEQLGEGLQSAILSNVGTLVSFRVSAPSGRRLEGEFGGHYGARELTDLERGQAIARLGKAGDSFAVHTFPPLTPEDVEASPGAESRITSATHAQVCRTQHEVEAELADDEARLQQLRELWQEEQAAKKRHAKVAAKGKVASSQKGTEANIVEESGYGEPDVPRGDSGRNGTPQTKRRVTASRPSSVRGDALAKRKVSGNEPAPSKSGDHIDVDERPIAKRAEVSEEAGPALAGSAGSAIRQVDSNDQLPQGNADSQETLSALHRDWAPKDATQISSSVRDLTSQKSNSADLTYKEPTESTSKRTPGVESLPGGNPVVPLFFGMPDNADDSARETDSTLTTGAAEPELPKSECPNGDSSDRSLTGSLEEGLPA